MFELKDTQDHYLESFEKQDAYNLVRKVALKSLKKFFTANESPYSFINTLSFSTVLQTASVVRVDPILDSIIIDTDISKKYEVKIPYPIMFIDKIFKSGNNRYIFGIGIYDVLFMQNLLRTHTVSFENYKIKIDKLENFEMIKIAENLTLQNSGVECSIPVLKKMNEDFLNDMDKIFITFYEMEELNPSQYDSSASLFLKKISVQQAIDLIHSKMKLPFARKISSTFDDDYNVITTDESLIDFREDEKDLLEDVIRYVFNVCFLINNHIKTECPSTHNNDFRMLPYYPNAKAKRANINRFSVIKVFGETRKYVDSYNHEHRKYTKHNIDSVLVRGHWRTFRHERYKEKLGKTIWIAPFLKGMDKELYRRIVKLEP